MYLHLYPLDNPSQLLARAVRKLGIVHAVPQVLIRFPTGRALPEKFFDGHVGIVVLVVCDLQQQLIDFYAVIVHIGPDSDEVQ
jgi:hypothetical protein